ncbi:Bcr/CflA family multidrug efflux MFS transporter [Actinoallomurus spadix]|uniref:Multidrug effflux MFS transporter n=1 Tax=Actinoallomurus spadix TaxID=79912 RepID=A0ABN0X0I2_9ACTN|nr:Bcr/CflA family multidrug efflux MFS transporter [Actinoallomurus spadix]MCO5989014.1 Bcr/CflA family multidrug efflux MFS transporter [Actinoallomurus spadix]
MPATASETIEAAPAQAGRLRLALILGALSAIGPLSIDMYLPALPKLTHDLSAGPSLVQLTLTACLVGLAVGQVVAGPLSDAWGRRRPLLAGVVLYTLASLLCAVAPSVPMLIALRLVQGAAGAAAIVIARAIVRDLYDGAEAARFFSLLMLVNGVAPIAAPVIGGQLLRLTSWRGVFVLIAVIGALMVAATWGGLRETLPPGARHTGGPGSTLRTFAGLFGDRVFVGYALSGGLAFAAMFAYISGSPFVVQDIYGLSPQAFSLIFAVNALGIVAAGQVSGRLVGRVRLRTLLTAGLVMSLAGGLALVVAIEAGLGLPGVLPALFLVVSAIGLITPNATALALTGRPPAVAGSASALVGLGQFVIGGVAAPLVGVAGSGTAVPMGAVIAALTAAAFLSYVTLTRGHRPIG